MAARRIEVRALISELRRLATSPDPLDRFRTLWITVLLHERLGDCTDREIGDLMVIVKKRLGIVEPEFAICYHAMVRLLRSVEERLRK
jgi:hypothetical protein